MGGYCLRTLREEILPENNLVGGGGGERYCLKIIGEGRYCMRTGGGGGEILAENGCGGGGGRKAGFACEQCVCGWGLGGGGNKQVLPENDLGRGEGRGDKQILPENNWGSDERRRFCLRIVREGVLFENSSALPGKRWGEKTRFCLKTVGWGGWVGGWGGGGANKYCVRTLGGG